MKSRWLTRPRPSRHSCRSTAGGSSHPTRRRAREGQLDGVRDPRPDLAEGAGEAALHRAVHMAAEDARDLRVAADHLGQRIAVLEHHGVHVVDAGPERRVVQGDQRRALRRAAELPVKPGELVDAEPACGLARDQAVEPDQAERAEVDREAERPLCREQVALGKGRPHQLAVVVIAGDREDRGPQASQHRHELGPDRSVAVVGQIARDQHRVGRRLERVQMVERLLEAAGGVDPAEGERALGHEMQIGNLGEQHRGPHALDLEEPEIRS